MDEVPGDATARETAHAQGHTLHSRRVGAAAGPLDHFLKRLRIEQFLAEHLTREDRRARTVTTAAAVLLLLRNLLISRSPSTASASGPPGTTLAGSVCPTSNSPALNDDRHGRALDRLFDADIPALALDVAAQAVSTFDVGIDELHNDSTTVTFHGDYENAYASGGW